MALKTRLQLLTLTQFSTVALTAAVLFIAVSFAFAGEGVPVSPTGMMWESIMALFGALNTILTGAICWLVSNQRETFQRIGKLETGEEVQSRICAERHQKRP